MRKLRFVCFRAFDGWFMRREADKTKLAVLVLILLDAALACAQMPAPGVDDVLTALPAALARVGAATSCGVEGGRRNWLDASDPRAFSSFICDAPRGAVDAAISAAGSQLNLDLLMACNGCTVEGLRRLLDLYREDSPHPERGDAAAPEPWRAVAPTRQQQARYLGVAERDCVMYRQRYEGGGRALTFLGIAHAMDLAPGPRERLFSRMGREFDGANPGAIVIEGLTGRPSCGEMMHYFFSSDPPRDELERSMIYGARQGIEIIGGEPPYSGFVSPDGPGLHLVADMGHGVSYEVALRGLARLFSPEEMAPFDTFDEFTAWYRRLNGREFSPARARDDSTPAEYLTAGTEVTELNRRFAAMTLARNDQLLATIRGALSRHRHVVAVYGNGHLPATGPALEEHVGAIDPAASGCGQR